MTNRTEIQQIQDSCCADRFQLSKPSRKTVEIHQAAVHRHLRERAEVNSDGAGSARTAQRQVANAYRAENCGSSLKEKLKSQLCRRNRSSNQSWTEGADEDVPNIQTAENREGSSSACHRRGCQGPQEHTDAEGSEARGDADQFRSLFHKQDGRSADNDPRFTMDSRERQPRR